jgi:hypothetical protein
VIPQVVIQGLISYFSEAKNKIGLLKKPFNMRINLRNLLIAFLFSVISPCGFVLVNAQDTSFPGTEMDDLGIDKESEKMMYNPGETDPAFRKAQTSSTIKDSLSLRASRPAKIQTPDTSKAPVKRPAEEDDSILSFNFLYYIFQKYKMQDIVD